MSWQQSACQQVGNLVARLLAGAVLLCVARNAVFLFFLPSRRSRRSDGRCQAQDSERRQPASSREGGQVAQRASSAGKQRESTSTDHRRPAAEQREGRTLGCWLGIAATLAEQRGQPMILLVPERFPSPSTSQGGGSPWPPAKPGQTIPGARWPLESGSLPKQRARNAEPPCSQ